MRDPAGAEIVVNFETIITVDNAEAACRATLLGLG